MTIKHHSLYVSDENRAILEDMKKIGDNCNVKVDNIIWACVRACYPTLRKDMPNKRVITLNGRKITV